MGKWTCESVKPGKDAAAAQIDHFGAGQGRLVRADRARHALAGDCEGTLHRQARIHRANDAVLQDHAGDTTAERMSK